MQQMTGNTMPEEQPPSVLAECKLDNVDCPICGNTGLIHYKKYGFDYSKDCECMKRRRTLRNIVDSGLQDLIQRDTFDTYEVRDEKCANIKRKALSFVNTDAEAFIITGIPGSGKTHICVAMCSALLDQGKLVRYFVWRTDAAKLKAMVNSGEEYQAEINRLRNAPVLYIDDFFKGSVTDADKNLAFTILNDRYNGKGKKTIISTELTIPELKKHDEAICGRIVERARGYIIQSPEEDLRLRGGQ